MILFISNRQLRDCLSTCAVRTWARIRLCSRTWTGSGLSHAGLGLDICPAAGVWNAGVVVSYQAQAPVLAAVLPSNSPGVHTLWLPVIPLQLGLVLKPGPQEPWTPYRMVSAFIEAGVPREVFGLYPGEALRRGRVSGMRSFDDIRRHCNGGTIQGRPASSARPRILENPAGRRLGGPVGGLPGFDGRKYLHQQRSRLH